jgi:hypothetical protein
MMEKLFINQHKWEMSKWIKKNRNSFPEDYKMFKMFAFLKYFGVIIGLSVFIFLILFLRSSFFNFLTISLLIGMFVSGFTIAFVGNKMQLPILQKILSSYVKEQSIQINFNVNGWIYRKTYYSIKSYKYGLIISILLYFPLVIFTVIITSFWIDFILIFFLSCLVLGFVILTNLPILSVITDKHIYPYVNFPLPFFYGLLISITLSINFRNEAFYFLVILILTIYLLIFWYIGKKILKIAQKDIQESLILDMVNYLSTEKEILLKYWKWIQSRRFLIKEMFQSGKMNDFELIENKIIKKK